MRFTSSHFLRCETLANAIFGNGLTILSSSFSGASVSSGTFADGPFGIGSGGILTSGTAVGALPGGDHYVNNGAAGSDTYCGAATYNAAILTVDLFLNPTFNGINFEYIMASEEEGGSADPVGIFLNGGQFAQDPDGNRLKATSRYLAYPLVITPPNSVTSYPGSSPPFLVGVPVSGAFTVVLAICDQGDAEWDSAVLFKAEGCVDCNTEVRLAYVTSTTTVPAGSTTFTSTTPASGTASGTVVIGVEAAETTTSTTTSESTTATSTMSTTTSEESTTATPSTMSTTTSEESTTATPSTTPESTPTITPTLTSTTSTTTTATPTTTESTTVGRCGRRLN
ncbi:hypothetical protein AUP68_05346 [Ilyonectria robusta]